VPITCCFVILALPLFKVEMIIKLGSSVLFVLFAGRGPQWD